MISELTRRLLLCCLLCGCAAAQAPADAGAGAAPPVELCMQSMQDGDGDGLSDLCELRLATWFAPELVTAPAACAGADRAAGDRPAGGYLYAVAPERGGVRVSYLPAYAMDCGWSGWKCGLPGVDCSAHAGDSELIVVDIASRASSWYVAGVFLSAHCFSDTGRHCRWYRGDELRRFRWAGARRASGPVVWVAEGRNANYRTRSECEAGHWLIDTCERNVRSFRFAVRRERNIGSRTQPITGAAEVDGCVTAAFVEVDLPVQLAGGPRMECFWSAQARFRGWHGSGSGATPYDRYLTEIAGW